MHRPTLGIVTLIVFAIGIGFLVAGDGHQSEFISNACLRMGILLGVLWLALPDASRPRNVWLLLALGVTAVLMAFHRRLIPVGICVVLLLAVLTPKRRPPERERRP